jgi:2-keto-3-deoxy-6-phosphogluconate aldolase
MESQQTNTVEDSVRAELHAALLSAGIVVSAARLILFPVASVAGAYLLIVPDEIDGPLATVAQQMRVAALPGCSGVWLHRPAVPSAPVMPGR